VISYNLIEKFLRYVSKTSQELTNWYGVVLPSQYDAISQNRATLIQTCPLPDNAFNILTWNPDKILCREMWWPSTCNLFRPSNVYPHFQTVRPAAIADLIMGRAGYSIFIPEKTHRIFVKCICHSTFRETTAVYCDEVTSNSLCNRNER
jgi:hypothetical protein